MRVKIVDQWLDGCNQNDNGLMDKYLGQVVTISDMIFAAALIEEDKKDSQRWYWNEHCFDYIVEDESEDFEPASDSDFLSFLFGNQVKGGENQ